MTTETAQGQTITQRATLDIQRVSSRILCASVVIQRHRCRNTRVPAPPNVTAAL